MAKDPTWGNAVHNCIVVAAVQSLRLFCRQRSASRHRWWLLRISRRSDVHFGETCGLGHCVRISVKAMFNVEPLSQAGSDVVSLVRISSAPLRCGR